MVAMPEARVSTPPTQPKETPKAAQAFADYVALGPSRSLRKLHEQYRQQTSSKPPAKSLDTLFDWSVKFGWQQRLADAATALSTAMLEQAAELDANTFLVSSRLLNERMNWSSPGTTDIVIRMRESVRKPMPKGGASVNVTVSVELRQQAERLAERLGITADELLADAEMIAAEQWEKV